MITGESSRVLPPHSGVRNRLFWHHAQTFNPVFDRLWGNRTSRIKRPIRSTLGFSKRRDEPSIAFVPAIHRHRHPPAVLRGVWPIVINAIKSQTIFAPFFGPFKEGNRLVPFGAYRDTATAIPGEVKGIGIGASLYHRIPHGIEMTFPATLCVLSVDGYSLGVNIPGLAPARRRVGKEFEDSDKARCPTNTNAGEANNVVRATPNPKLCPHEFTDHRPVPEFVSDFDRKMFRHIRIVAEDTTGN